MSERIIKTKDSRAKIRRWTFEAEVILSGQKQRLKLDTTMYGTSADARSFVPAQEEQLRKVNASFAETSLRVIPNPCETISPETLAQINSAQNMLMILERAFELSLTEPSPKDLTTAQKKERFVKLAVESFAPKPEPSRIIVPEGAGVIQIST